MHQSGRAGGEAKKRKSPAKSGRVGITGLLIFNYLDVVEFHISLGLVFLFLARL